MGESIEPRGDFCAQDGDFNFCKRVGIGIEPSQRCLQERGCSRGIASLQVMERRCHLDQGLQESFLRLIAAEPDTLPVFVSREEFPIAITSQPFGKLPAAPVKTHRHGDGKSALEYRSGYPSRRNPGYSVEGYPVEDPEPRAHLVR